MILHIISYHIAVSYHIISYRGIISYHGIARARASTLQLSPADGQNGGHIIHITISFIYYNIIAQTQTARLLMARKSAIQYI